MKGNVMLSGHSTADSAQVIPMVSHRDTNTYILPFGSNSEHLKSLENEAKIMVAVAALRRRKISTDDPTNQIPCFAILPEGTDLNRAILLLEEISAENRSRENLSVSQGIALNYPEFCDKWQLDDVERKIILLLLMQFSSPGFYAAYESSGLEKNCDNGMEIGSLLSLLSCDLGEQLEYRRYFSINGKLINNELLSSDVQHMGSTSSILRVSVYLHERFVRHIVGDTNQYHAAFRFIRHERSCVNMDQVILPKDLKAEIVHRAERFMEGRRRGAFDHLDNFFSYGTGLVFIFHGASGTGKTMLAKGLANHLSCPLISLNAEDLGDIPLSNDEIMETLFREAALVEGIVFLDECDDVFGGHKNTQLSRSLLLEIEKSRCITILATNKPVDLDPAMERRIGMKVQFPLPDAQMRLQMWQALLPPAIALGPDVNLALLADRYKFSGGLIKNSIFLAITASSNTASSETILSQKDLERAAELQTSTTSDLNHICTTIKPHESLDFLPLSRNQRDELRGLARAWNWLSEQDLGLNLLFDCNDIDTGVSTVLGLAAECHMCVRMFDFSQVTSLSDDAKLIDPVSQRRISPLKGVFSTINSKSMITLFVDHSGDLVNILNRDIEDKVINYAYVDLFSQMRVNKGLFCMLTKEIKHGNIPIEFHQHITLAHPPMELQIMQWESDLGSNVLSNNDLVELAERYPMHNAEISYIARQIKVRSIMNGRSKPCMHDIDMVISRYRRKSHSRILFGGDR